MADYEARRKMLEEQLAAEQAKAGASASQKADAMMRGPIGRSKGAQRRRILEQMLLERQFDERARNRSPGQFNVSRGPK